MKIDSIDRDVQGQRYIFKFSANGAVWYRFLDDDVYWDRRRCAEWFQSLMTDIEKRT